MSIRKPATPRSSQIADDVLERLPVAARPRRVDRVPPRLAVRMRRPTRSSARAARRRSSSGSSPCVVPVTAPRPACPGCRASSDRAGGCSHQMYRSPVRVRPVGGQLALEPRVLDRGVPGDEVEHDPDAALPGLRDQLDHVVVGAVPGSDREVVGDVVAGIDERRREARVEPDHVRRRARRCGPAARSRPADRRCRRRRSRRTTVGRSRTGPRRRTSPHPWPPS